MEYKMNVRNIKAIEQAGGVPVILPYYMDATTLVRLLEEMDGLYLPGGYDIDPSLFGEEPHVRLGTIIPERDRMEKELIQYFLKEDKPILGVCRGSQILNVVTGGKMYQDLGSQYGKAVLQHMQNAGFHHRSHSVDIVRGTLLERLVDRNQMRVNSFHHQANASLAAGFIVSAASSDGVIEAFESEIHRFVLGIQWHPEGLIDLKDDPSIKIYEGFIDAAR